MSSLHRPGLIALAMLAAVGLTRAQETVPAEAPAVAAPAEGDADTFRRDLSYCLGADLGRRLRSDEINVDLAALVAGIRDALTNAKPALSDEQMDAVMTRFQDQIAKKVEQRMAAAAQQNLVKGQEFLAANAAKEGVQQTDSGLQYRVVEEGDGPSPGPTDTVRCHYRGTLIDGTEFDSSYGRGQPAEFPVNRVIAGWTEALQMMKVGGKWEVFLPSEIAYGAQGAGGAIGPNETLIFTIELLAIVD